MNVANLQIEGLCLAIAALNQKLVEKGILSRSEIDEALREAEATARGDDRFVEDLNPSNRDAICFPIRVLQIANSTEPERPWTFSDLARLVGSTKEPYNDML
ncbi:hypothetical protein [Brucella sp. IR073]|uniref:hypothetical protein n=1 Tax=unclassified Brucella TaxID=2632610 RepID=UPI003B981141